MPNEETQKLSSVCMGTFVLRGYAIIYVYIRYSGNMTGSGVYVLTGTVIRDRAGPSIFLSYLLAGFTALLNAFCYAELAGRIPRVSNHLGTE